jgi:hypothetical protein
MSRWFRVSTDIFEHELFAQSEMSEREAFLWIVAKAAWKETRHRIGADMVPVPRGSLFVTLRELCSAWGWKSDHKVRTFLDVLERERMVEKFTGAGKTRLTVCNYDKYQNPPQESGASEAQGGRTEGALKIPVYQNTKEEVGEGRAQERDESPSLDTRKAICEIYAKAGALPPETGRAVVWLERGYSHDEIIATVSSSVKPGKVPSSLAYFDQPLERMRLIPVAPPRPASSARAGPIHHPKPQTANDYLASELRRMNNARPDHDEFGGITIDASPS